MVRRAKVSLFSCELIVIKKKSKDVSHLKMAYFTKNIKYLMQIFFVLVAWGVWWSTCSPQASGLAHLAPEMCPDWSWQCFLYAAGKKRALNVSLKCQKVQENPPVQPEKGLSKLTHESGERSLPFHLQPAADQLSRLLNGRRPWAGQHRQSQQHRHGRDDSKGNLGF